MKNKNIILEHKDLFLGLIAVCFISLISIMWSTEWFRASVLQIPEKFDWTIMPVEKIPNWWTWWWDNKVTLYSKIDEKYLMDIPSYSLSLWGEWPSKIKENNTEKMAKLTYAVVYLWDYDIENRIEWKGSHLAVDIRIPVWTPLRSVANWKIIKVDNRNSWFWKHIVIEMPNVPDISNKNRKTTYYASYNHMDSIVAKEWQIIKKWELIWYSWNSWTSTTPHLHFQIDTKEASWHPYWPFTSQEAYAANLNFFTAIEEWLWMENAKKYTINPMKWVEDNLDTIEIADSNEEEGVTDEEEVTLFSKFKISWEWIFKTDSNTTISMIAEDSNWNVIEDFKVKSWLELSSTSNTARFSKTLRFNDWVASLIVSNRQAEEFTFKIEYENQEFIKEFESILAETEEEEEEEEELLHVINTNDVAINSNDNLHWSADWDDDENEEDLESEKIDENVKVLIQWDWEVKVGKKIILNVFINDKNWAFAEVTRDYSVSLAWVWEVEPKILKINDFISSKAKISFKSDKEWEAIILINWEEFEIKVNKKEEIVIVEDDNDDENLHWSAEDNNENPSTSSGWQIENTDSETNSEWQDEDDSEWQDNDSEWEDEKDLFSDVSKNHENYEAIKYLKEEWVVWWYEDWTFQPTKIVSRVEALKMIFAWLKINISNPEEINFPDTSNDAWYSPYIWVAVEKWIAKGYPDWTFWPAKEVNRSEYYKILLLSAEILPTAPEYDPYSDVPAESWFGSYIWFVKDSNLIDVDWENFWPSEWVSRAEVAESLYRLIKLLDK